MSHQPHNLTGCAPSFSNPVRTDRYCPSNGAKCLYPELFYCQHCKEKGE